MTAGSPGVPWNMRLGEDHVLGRAAVPIGVVHVGIGEGADAAAAIDAARGNQHVLGLAPIGAAIHPQRPADRARNAAQERQPGDRGLLGGARHLDVRHRGAGADARALLYRDIAEPATEPDHHARNAAVAHDEIGAEADHGDGNLRRQVHQEIRQVLFVFRHEQNLRGPADPEPCQLGERLIGDEPPAQRGHCGVQVRDDVGESQLDSLREP